jgi:hypothetical protein
LPTAIDSALVLLGVDDPASVARLERFGQADGSYVPQLWAPERTTDCMELSEGVRHWCQADLATTALVRHLRAAAGLPTVTPLSHLADQYETRSSLFVANPYLMDLLFALAIERDPDASSLRDRLAEDILGSMDDRHGFGSFDPQLSTACAILALAALGHRGRALRLAQIRLANIVNDDARRELAVPFYSTVTTSAPALRTPSVLPVGRTWQALTLYEDTFRVVGTALRARALAEHADPTRDDLPATATAHRAATPYGANGPADYVARIALPRYFGLQRSEQLEQRVT